VSYVPYQKQKTRRASCIGGFGWRLTPVVSDPVQTHTRTADAGLARFIRFRVWVCRSAANIRNRV
jgi:hypothetical protein